jgi:hypothetical protein
VLLCAAQVDPLPPILRSIPGRRSHRVQKGSPIAIEYLVTTLDVPPCFSWTRRLLNPEAVSYELPQLRVSH